jgi:sigma-B regulation protein RsbU (phosphoserine phosphatase)
VLGAFDGVNWRPASVELEPGDLLVSYTDGVTEAESAGERFGDERLRRRLEGMVSPADAVRHVEEELERFTEGRLRDDAAIVAIMRDPEALRLGRFGALRESRPLTEAPAGA